ncbi:MULTISPECIES: SigE family RNA polymerase sigma factor [Catenuloplanes]|uniref:RNA polymerase sigma-70 factor (Sigma-E family) n=1 Tax=Catenuloplanes niger TaxID=587534 RepID=A0AAE3ZTB9_9ACTN|nr:SigE family RNA polymerase sigma factor [Catenuloplanes niger]MDR7324632.1 RNA polymerase sigma-70 factor (sigma-E family) [Catenuloplanes niger]
MTALDVTTVGVTGKAARHADFTEFATAATPRLRRTAYLMTRDWHLAQDLTQTTLAKMFASWRRVRRASNLDAYSRKVLMNVVFDHRRRRRDVVVAETPDRGVDGGGRAELQVTLLRALATLPDRDQAVVVLRHWEDRSVEAVAEILGISASAVKMRDMRALARLRAELGEDVRLS